MDFPVDQLTEEQIKYFLPEGFLSYADLLSTTGLFALVERFGGTRVRIPSREAPDHRLRQVLSSEDYDSLCKGAGGIVLEIPVASRFKRFQRDCAVFNARKNGMTIPEVARKFSMSERNVYRLLRDQADRFEDSPFSSPSTASAQDQAG